MDGTALVITFDEDLAAAPNLANDAFTVKKTPAGGSEEEVDLSSAPPSISGATVTLTLASAVAAGDTVTVSYEKPDTDDSNRLEDAAGNEVLDFTDRPVVNNTTDTLAPEFASAVLYGTTLDITFTEALAPATNLTNDAFEVKKTPYGGSAELVALSATPPSISGNTVTLTLASGVAYDDTVTVSYEKLTGSINDNRLEDAAGNEVADFTDRPVTVDNMPATGRPAIYGTLEVGQVLTADAIEDTTRPDPVVTLPHSAGFVTDPDGKMKADSGEPAYAYRYTWIRVDGNGRSNPTVVAVDQDTYTLVAADEGKKFRVQVRFTDDKGNAEGPLTSMLTDNDSVMDGTVAGDDTTAPQPLSAKVNGAALAITFDEDLDAAANPANTAFTVKKTPAEGSEQTVALSATTPPSISGNTVTLTLASAVADDDVVTVSYTKPTTGSNNKLADAAGNETATFTDMPVTNNTNNNVATGNPGISGTLELGQVLTATEGSIADDDDGLPTFPDDYAFQWIRVDADGSNPVHVGSNQDNYTLVGDDVGKWIKVEVRFTDASGNAEGPLTSDPHRCHRNAAVDGVDGALRSPGTDG